jgi:ABC-type glycerol-3-phosphate transport system substrate-binding protein
MKKIRKLRGLAFLMTAASCLAACGSSGNLKFWSPFGDSYQAALEKVCARVTKATGVKI